MCSLLTPKFSIALLAALCASGCLVSEEPVLDERSGRSLIFDDGRYIVCPLDEDARADECDSVEITKTSDRAHKFSGDEEDAVVMRFRRVGSGGYAVQSAEGDEFLYYYGQGTKKRFSMTLMSCAALPEKLRARLITDEDLATDDDDYTVCTVNSVKGLRAAAKAYHRGEAADTETISLVITPEPKD